MWIRIVAIIACFALPGFAQDWNPRLAAQYLDSRQKEWFVWPTAKTAEGPCISCHTGMTYLLARPALRRSLGEKTPTEHETGLLNSLRTKVQKRNPVELGSKPSDALGVDAVFSALFLATQDYGKATLSEDTLRAFDELWAMQIREGKGTGSWPWFSLDLQPWEMPESAYYGATLAAQAVAMTPASYRNRPEVQQRVSALVAYLQREKESQPLHNRLALLWAATTMPNVMPGNERKVLVAEVLKKQEADGGWTLESLGQWAPRPKAPASPGSNAYATGFVAFVLQKAGVKRSDTALTRALSWLRSRQEAQSGSWAAMSMNKPFEPDSMQVRFMRDAATAFAALALLEGR